MRKDGQKEVIIDVMYMPYMTSNLISIDQLLAKGYNIKMMENQVEVIIGEGILILRAPLADNKTFKIEINIVDYQCLALTTT